MSELKTINRMLVARALALVALVMLAFAYVSPTWWVSLEAPQYPEVAFPQGIRIHFHLDGVFNGCQKVEVARSEEHTSELQSQSTISYAVFCLKTKKCL